MNKLSALLLLLSLSPLAAAQTADKLPADLRETRETVQGYQVYGTNSGVVYLDGLNQEGKLVGVNFLSLLMGHHLMLVLPAKTWADVPLDEDGYIDHLTNTTLYEIRCEEQTARRINLKQAPVSAQAATLPLKQMSKVEQAAAQMMCDIVQPQSSNNP